MREVKNAYIILVEKPEGKTLLRLPRHRWKNNIKTDLKERGCERLDFTDFVQHRDQWLDFVNMVMSHIRFHIRREIP
jgi:hypothetical protein